MSVFVSLLMEVEKINNDLSVLNIMFMLHLNNLHLCKSFPLEAEVIIFA